MGDEHRPTNTKLWAKAMGEARALHPDDAKARRAAAERVYNTAGGGWAVWLRVPATVAAAGKRFYVRYPEKLKTAKARKEFRFDVYEDERRKRRGMSPSTPNPKRWTVGELVTWWLETYLKAKPSYAKTKPTCEKHLIRSPLGKLPADQMAAAHFERYLQQLIIEEKRSNTTLNRIRSYAHRAYALAIKAGHFHSANPLAKVERRREEKLDVRVLTPREMSSLLAALEPRWQGMFAVLAFAGLRLGEVCGLRKEDVDLTAKCVHVRRGGPEKTTTKGKRARTVSYMNRLHPYLCAVVDEAEGPWLFTTRNGGPRTSMHQSAPNQALKRALRRCGLPEIRVHDLRHTFGTWLAASGVNDAQIKELMGHSSMAMVELYRHLAQTHLTTAIEALDRFAEVSEAAEEDHGADVIDLGARRVK